MNKKSQKIILLVCALTSIVLIMEAIMTKLPIVITCAVVASLATIVYAVALIVKKQ